MFIKGVRMCGGYRCHEDGDQGSIPCLLFCNTMLDPRLRHDQLPRLHHAVSVTKPRRPHAVHEPHDTPGQGQGQGHHMLSREGRVRTFDRDWQGPNPVSMAEAGFYQDETAGVACPFCPVRFRRKAWLSGDDPWEKHRNLSSNCRLMRLSSLMGKKKFRHSCTSLHILGRH